MYAIVIVHEPTDRLEAEPQWNEFLNKTRDISKTTSKNSVLPEGLFQLSLNPKVDILVKILSEASIRKFSYQFLILDNEPIWLTS